MSRKGFLLTTLMIALVLTYPAIRASAVGVGKDCGGPAGIQCDKGLWCDPQPGRCGGRDLPGVCVDPKDCTMVIVEVCGCNKTTYSECQRQKARVAKKHDGRCQSKK
jgi:hypothetical protein